MEASKANSKANSKEPVGKEPVGKEPAENGKPARSSKPAEKSSLRLPPSVSLSRSIRLPYSGRHNTEPVAGAAALSVSALCVSYPGASEPALKEANLELPAGVRAALVGANGSGKSTLLKAVAGLLPALSGDIEIYGNPVGACHHRVAYLPQRGDIDWRFPISVSRLVLGGRYVHLGWLRRPGRKDRQVAKEVMERLGIEPLAGRQIGELSGGQQQRALLARALAQQADLLLLDEPLAGVDAATQQAVFNVLEELKGEGRTLVVATHDLERLEEEFEGVVYLKEGRVVEPVAGAYVGIDFRKQATGEQAAS